MKIRQNMVHSLDSIKIDLYAKYDSLKRLHIYNNVLIRPDEKNQVDFVGFDTLTGLPVIRFKK
jgi:hypothetical protein